MGMSTSRKTVVLSSSIAVSVVIAVMLISMQLTAAAPPTFIEGKLSATRVPESAEIQDVSNRAEYLPVPPAVLEQNPKLSMVLAGADSSYEMNSQRSSSIMAEPLADPVFMRNITEDDANGLISMWKANFITVDHKVSGNIAENFHHMKIQIDGKFYFLTIYTTYKQ